MKAGLIGLIGEQVKADMWGTLSRVAEIGYRGIEGGEFLLNGDVGENLKRFHGLGLQVLTVSALREPLRDKLDELIVRAKALESRRVSCWWGPAESREQILRDAELYNTAGARLAAEGIQLCYHNHDHEFRKSFEGVYAMDLLIANTDAKAVHFVIDIMWATFGGEDPARLLRRLAGRVASIHVKDTPSLGTSKAEFTAVGTGVVDIPEAVKAAGEIGVQWAVVEQDRLRHLSAFETITLSYLYLKECGLIEA